MNIKFYEEVKYLKISRSSLVKTVPFVSQYLRSESITVSKNGFCTISYEAYEQFLKKRHLNDKVSNLDIYVLDTGIQSSHVAFNNRVIHGYDAISNPPLKSDPNGHGTQVAGIIAGEYYGLVNNANIIDVRVADENGIANIDHILGGLDYMIGRYLSLISLKGYFSATAVFSLSGQESRILKQVLFSISKVLLVIGAAGDSDSFSCNFSPANSPFPLITAATVKDGDVERPGSNYGDCIDVYAPGDEILSPWIGKSNNEESYLSGSSASTAVVAGMVGVILNFINSNHTVVFENKNLELYTALRELITEDYTILLRNILLTTKHHIFQSIGSREAHPDTVNLCDLMSIQSVHDISLEYYRKLKTKDKSSPITRIKNNFMAHQKQKLQSLYDD